MSSYTDRTQIKKSSCVPRIPVLTYLFIWGSKKIIRSAFVSVNAVIIQKKTKNC